MAEGAGAQVIRGSRIGTTSSHEVERGETVPRQHVTYYCARDHRAVVAFAADAEPPSVWDCPRCGLPAGLDPAERPDAPRIQPFKTHLAYVKERRTEAEAADILDEALQLLRQRRRSGEIVL